LPEVSGRFVSPLLNHRQIHQIPTQTPVFNKPRENLLSLAFWQRTNRCEKHFSDGFSFCHGMTPLFSATLNLLYRNDITQPPMIWQDWDVFVSWRKAVIMGGQMPWA
jgi:hypothetical protein